MDGRCQKCSGATRANESRTSCVPILCKHGQYFDERTMKCAYCVDYQRYGLITTPFVNARDSSVVGIEKRYTNNRMGCRADVCNAR